MENLMFKKIVTLFKLGRKIAKSDILSITSKFQEPPLIVKVLFKLLSFSFSSKKQLDMNKDEGERLSSSLESILSNLVNFLLLDQILLAKSFRKNLKIFKINYLHFL